jgi:hypothetical protein
MYGQKDTIDISLIFKQSIPPTELCSVSLNPEHLMHDFNIVHVLYLVSLYGFGS